MAAVDSGLISARAKRPKRKKKPAAKKPRNRKAPMTTENLPEEESTLAPEAQPEQPKKSLFSGLFSSQTSPNQSDGSKDPTQSDGSGKPLEASEIPAEVKAQLDKVPDVIGDDAEASTAGQGSAEAAVIGTVLQSFVFDEKTVKNGLVWIFDGIAAKRESDHWKLDEKKLDVVTEPTTQMANQAWASIRDYIPTLLASAVEKTPGLMAFLIGWGSVLTPMVMEDLKLQRERATKIHEWKTKEAN